MIYIGLSIYYKKICASWATLCYHHKKKHWSCLSTWLCVKEEARTKIAKMSLVTLCQVSPEAAAFLNSDLIMLWCSVVLQIRWVKNPWFNPFQHWRTLMAEVVRWWDWKSREHRFNSQAGTSLYGDICLWISVIDCSVFHDTSSAGPAVFAGGCLQCWPLLSGQPKLRCNV